MTKNIFHIDQQWVAVKTADLRFLVATPVEVVSGKPAVNKNQFENYISVTYE